MAAWPEGCTGKPTTLRYQPGSGISHTRWARPTAETSSLTLKQLGFFFQNAILFSCVAHYRYNISVWNWSNTMLISSAPWVLMVWYFSTRASVATVLNTHPCVSSFFRGVKLCTQNMMTSWHGNALYTTGRLWWEAIGHRIVFNIIRVLNARIELLMF